MAVEDGILDRNPTAGIRVNVPEVEQSVLTNEEVKTFLQAAKDTSHRFYPIWVMALGTGMRSGELFALDWAAFIIVGIISAVTIAVGIWGFLAITKNVAIANLQEIQSKLDSTGKFHSTSVNDHTISNKSGTIRSIIVQTYVAGPLNQTREDLKPAYDLAFQTIRDQLKDVSQYNNLRVGLRLGYNLGIRKRFTTLFQDENPNKPGERKDAGSNSNF